MKVLSWNPKTKNVGKLCALVAKEQDHEKLAELTGYVRRVRKVTESMDVWRTDLAAAGLAGWGRRVVGGGWRANDFDQDGLERVGPHLISLGRRMEFVRFRRRVIGLAGRSPSRPLLQRVRIGIRDIPPGPGICCCALVKLARSNTWRFVVPRSLVGSPISDKRRARCRPFGQRPHAGNGRAIK